MVFAKRDDVIEKLAAGAADPAFRHPVLSRCSDVPTKNPKVGDKGGSISVGSSIGRSGGVPSGYINRGSAHYHAKLRFFCRHSIRCWRLIGCALGGTAFVVMMQTAHFTKFHHSTLCWRLYSSGLRCVFVERQVSSPLMVISAVRHECPMQRAFAEYDDMIQALAPNGPDEPFDVGPLPRGSRRR